MQLSEFPVLDKSDMTKLESTVAFLKERIQSGTWGSGYQLPSKDELAGKLDVSPTTISNAIRQLVREGLVYAISGKGVYVSSEEQTAGKGYAIGVKMGYQQSATPKALGPRGLPLFEELWFAADQNGCYVVLLNSILTIQQQRNPNPDGVIFIGGNTHEEAIALSETGVPVIACNRPVGPTPLSYLDYDNEAALREIVKRFASLGHRRIAILSNDTTVKGYFPRMKGAFLEALSDAGILADFQEAYWRYYDCSADVENLYDPARNEIKALLDLPEPPTAIFTWVSGAALCVLEEAARRGLKVPRDLSVATATADMETSVSFSGFRLPYRELAQQLVEEMIAAIENPYRHVQRLVPLQSMEGATLGKARQ